MTISQREQAIRRIRAKRDFRLHITAYVVVNSFLVLIWWLTGAGYFWPMWPMLGWGIGLVLHAVTVYMGTSEITEAQIEEEMHGRSGS